MESVARSFLCLGLDRFGTVAVMSANSPEWHISSLGAIFAGGISSGIYTTSSPEVVSHLCNETQVQILLLENQSYLRTLMQNLAWKSYFPGVKAVVLMEEQSVHPDELPKDMPKVLTWKQMLQLGDSQIRLEQIEEDQGVNEAVMMFYTSGSTGFPKG